MSVMEIMDQTGDTKLTWEADDEKSVAAAQEAFDAARSRGMVATTISERGEPGEVVTRFPVDAERVILRPAMQGG